VGPVITSRTTSSKQADGSALEGIIEQRMYICDGAKDGRRRCYNELKHSRSGRSPTRLRLTYVLQGA